jgi:hypothetical protein
MAAAVAAGVHPYVLKLLVNHALPKADVTASYLREDEVEARREPQERISEWLLRAVGASPASDSAPGATIAAPRALPSSCR